MVAADVDVLLVAYAGGAGWGPDADLDLVGACVTLEAELREREWDALQRVLAATVDGELRWPAEARARAELFCDVEEIGWLAPGAPEGANGMAPGP